MKSSPQSSQYVLSGLRPTGRVHLGNYFGAVRNWVRLQDLYTCYYFVADWHALTSDYADTSKITQATFDAVADWIAAGMDPAKSTIFVQSEVKEHAELHLLLSMVTPLPWLERVPTFKDQQDQLQDKELNTYGFLGYPLLQTADIIIYRANFVPVGEDQASHLEISREIVRRFNNFFGDVFPEPQVLLTETPKVPGLDGRKMSKSYGNTIPLTASADEIRALVMTMFTDPERIRRKDPGRPAVCNLFQFHKLFSNEETIARVDHECRTAQIGCVDDKKMLAEIMIETLRPIREKREAIDRDPSIVWDALRDGNRKARERAHETMELVRSAVKITYPELR
ncbi:MAG: tryptophanyl-tRNA synthetase [Thermoanaerobaculia bacterium]|nr:tryptophanyl-tRNA synthetase [Thermoanaerobaculia bacterium]